jgi:periplasmic divalent cation tolerance protein
MMADPECIVVLVTVGSVAEGEHIARALVGEGLAACVNRLGPIRSTYAWKGEVADCEEHLLLIKTRHDGFSALERRVRELHGYEVPEVIAVPVSLGSLPYLDWVRAESAGRRVGS